MKLLRPRTFFVFALAGLSGAVLLHASQNVQQAEDHLAAIELSIYRQQEKTRMLKAEWEALNSPNRLERLAKEFLDLAPVTPEQVSPRGEKFFDKAHEKEATKKLPPAAFRPASILPEQSVPKPSIKPMRQKGSPDDSVKSFGELLRDLGGD